MSDLATSDSEHYVHKQTSIHHEHVVRQQGGFGDGLTERNPAGRLAVGGGRCTFAVVITFNHVFTLGSGAFVLGAILLAVPPALWIWFRRTGNIWALAAYGVMNGWIVVGFGVIKGLWGITLPIFAGTFLSSLSTVYPKPVFGGVGFEISGVAMFLGSLFVLYYGLQLVPNHGRPVVLAGVAAIGVTAILLAFVALDRDVWTPPTQGVVKIGVIVPTTGPYAMLGNSFVKAVQMARDDLKDKKYRYELVIRDSGPDPEKAKQVIRRVVNDDKVDAIVGGISLIGQQTKPYATAARIPHLCVCTVSWIGDGAYNFTNIPSPEAEAELWAREAQRRGITRVALLTQDDLSINNHVKANIIGTSISTRRWQAQRQIPVRMAQ